MSANESPATESVCAAQKVPKARSRRSGRRLPDSEAVIVLPFHHDQRRPLQRCAPAANRDRR
ncbi:hypothetical protein [Acrocarpospora sp. B8E8]|uniref:hypothetical protein n=1 Tax=Acrocarpospora sp. B8E8 TaxID=3153572 RepID=UPI00325FD202